MIHTQQNRVIQASILVAISGGLYGFLGYFGTKILQEDFSITAMLFWRFLVAACCLLPIILKSYFSARHNVSREIKSITYMFLFGALTYAGSSVFYFIASQYTGTGLAMVIFFSYPVLVALFSWLLYRSQLTKNMILVFITMIIGLSMLQQQTDYSFNLLGIFFGVLGATCYAIYVMGSKYVAQSTIDTNTMTFVVSLGCAMFFLCVSLAQHQFSVPHSINSIILLLALGVLATAIPIQLMLYGLKYISSTRASLLSVIEPIVTMFIGVLALGETMSHFQWIGAAILLASGILVQFERKL